MLVENMPLFSELPRPQLPASIPAGQGRWVGWYRVPGQRWQQYSRSDDRGKVYTDLLHAVVHLVIGRHADTVILPAGEHPAHLRPR